MATQSCILVTVLLFWSSAISSSLPRGRESRQITDTLTVQFTLSSSYTSECLTGLTENGTQIRVEVRFLTGQDFKPGKWISAGDIPLAPGFFVTTVTLSLSLSSGVSEITQFRMFQSEHGGGSCNCWELSNFTVNTTVMDIENTIDITEHCDEQSSSVRSISTGAMGNVRSFCGGSASVPRGIATAPLGLGNTTIQCNQVNGSTMVIDPRGTIDTENCTAAYPRLDIDFNLDLLEGEECMGPNRRFDEGVELAIRIGRDWIPLQYITPSLMMNQKRHPSISLMLNDPFVAIRGNYFVETVNNTEDKLQVSVCGSLLSSVVQLRWMQTALSNSQDPTTDPNNWRDLWTLDNVTVVLHVNQTYNETLIKDNFDNQTELNSEYWREDIRNGMISDYCGADYDGDNSLLMGSVCNTTDCGRGLETISSRIILTAPLDIGVQLGLPTDEPVTVTDPPPTPSPSTLPPTTQSPSTTASMEPDTTPDASTQSPPSTTASMEPDTTPDASTQSPPTTSPPSTTASMEPDTTPDASTPDADDRMALQQLGDALDVVLDLIGNDSELAAITTLPPAVAATTLEGVVGAREEVDETVVAYLLGDMVSRSMLPAGGVEDLVSFSETIHSVGDMVLEQTMDSKVPSTVAGSTILSLFDELAVGLLGMNQMRIQTERIRSNVTDFVEGPDDDDDDVLGVDTDGHSISLPARLLRGLANETNNTGVTVISAFYRNMSGLLPGNLPGGDGFELASPVLATSLRCGRNLCTIGNNTNITITITHTDIVKERIENDNTSQVMCVFWEFFRADGNPLSNGSWDTDDCVRNDNLSNSTHTVCECTHLTNFAILLSAKPFNPSFAVALSLSIIGYIGVSLSVLAMLATILALSCLRSLWSMRNFIHINLCVSLILAQLTFVIGVTPYGGGDVVDPGCRTAAVLMHYLFLVSFMWMLMEGVVLYIVLIKVFFKHQSRYMIGFFLFSYGAPLLYMVLCVPLGFAVPHLEDSYGYQLVDDDGNTTTVCWLSPLNNFIYTFIAPVILTILLNIGFFIMALVVMCRHSRKQKHKSKLESAKGWIKSSISLVAVMGITWIIGVVVFEFPGLLPLAYIFTIFVAFQGLAIFIIFVPLSKQVREAYSKWWKVKVAESDILSKHFGELTFTSSTKMTNTHNGSSHNNGSSVANTSSSVPPLDTIVSHHEASEVSEEKKMPEEKRELSFRRHGGSSFDITFVPAADFPENDDEDHVKVDLSKHNGDSNDNKASELTESTEL